MKPRPVLRYHGGKWLLAPWIISHFPRHRIYVEPFGGAASVLMRKEPARVEVYNDLWSTVVNVFRVLREPAKAADLGRLLYLTPFARDEFRETSLNRLEGLSDVEQARRTILRSFAGFGSASTNGDHATGFRAVTAKSAPKAAANWANYPGQIAYFVDRLRTVVVENRPALEVIRRYDGPDTLFYLDPPYPHCTRSLRRGNATYAHEMTDDDHVALALTLRAIQGMAIISGYDCKLYRCCYGGWTRASKKHIADGGRRREESIWLNPAVVARMPAPLFPVSDAAAALAAPAELDL